MKRVLGIILALTIVLCSMPFAASALTQPIEGKSSNAADVLKAQLTNATANGTAAWSIKQGNSLTELANITNSPADFKTLLNTAGGWFNNAVVAKEGHLGYNLTYMSYTAYESGDFETLKGNGSASVPSKGVIITAGRGSTYGSFTYTVPENGKITLSDPTGGKITSVISVGSAGNTGSLDDAEKSTKFAIYKGTDKIWPTDSDYYTFNSSNASIDFPDLGVIDVVEGDTINLVFFGTQIDAVMALNPQIDYVEDMETNNAATVFSAALENDISNGTMTILNESGWSYKAGSAIDTMTIPESGSIGGLGVYKSDGAWSDTSKAITGLNGWNTTFKYYGFAPYDASTPVTMTGYTGYAIPQQGIVISNTGTAQGGTAYSSINYTAPKSGTVKISDPDDGKIVAVQKFEYTDSTGTAQTYTTFDKYINFAIYQNGNMVWPESGTAHQFRSCPNNLAAIDFPEFELDVAEGDEISFVFSGATGAIYLALNPQVDYVEKVNPDNAASAIAKALSEDGVSKTVTELNASKWDITIGDYDVATTKQFFVKNFAASGWPAVKPYEDLYSYAIGNNSPTDGYNDLYSNVTVFNATHTVLDRANNPVVPATGILSVVHKRTVTYTYTPSSDGYIKLYDPEGGKISIVQNIGEADNRINTCTDASATVTFYKNDELLETVSLTNVIAFPEITTSVTTEDKIKICISASSGNNLSVAMNPQVDYIEEPGMTTTNLASALEAALAEGNANIYKNAGWTISQSGWNGQTDCTTYKKFTFVDKRTDPWTYPVPYDDKYAFTSCHPDATFNSVTTITEGMVLRASTETDEFDSKIPTTGVLAAGGVNFAYTAPESGYIKIFDPEDGNISLVQWVGEGNTCTLRSGTVTFAINGETIAAVELTDDKPYAVFPTIAATVEAGDVISISTSEGTSVAMNPQINYIETEYGDVNGNNSVDMLDLIAIKNLALSNGYTKPADLNDDLAVNAVDYMLLRKYLWNFFK